MPGKPPVCLPYAATRPRCAGRDVAHARMLVYEAMPLDELEEATKRSMAKQRQAYADLQRLRAAFETTGIPRAPASTSRSRVNLFAAAQLTRPANAANISTSMSNALAGATQDDDVEEAYRNCVNGHYFEALLGQQLRLRLLRESRVDLSRIGDVVLHEMQRLQNALGAGHRQRRDLNAARCIEQREYRRTRDHLQHEVRRATAKVRALESALCKTVPSPLASLASDDKDEQ